MTRTERSAAAAWGMLVLRVGLGCSMTYHGFEKLLPPHASFFANPGGGIAYFSHFVVSLGLPAWLGVVSVFTEFVGGLCLLFGLLTRFAALMVLINMCFALVTVNIKHGLAGSEYTLVLIVMAASVVLLGGGHYSLDRRLNLPLS